MKQKLNAENGIERVRKIYQWNYENMIVMELSKYFYNFLVMAVMCKKWKISFTLDKDFIINS
jgi:hypothetical protein